MISVEEALARLLAPLTPLAAEQVALPEALGRVLAEDVAARRTQPPFAVSAMDGYAVRSADVAQPPAQLRIVATVPAGQAFAGTLGPGEAVRIFTGAPMPRGADCVVIQEDTQRAADLVTIREGAPAGRYVRPAGLDFRAGEVGLRAGDVLTARGIGLAAAMNRPWLMVRRRPRVAILATGDEIVMPGDPSGPHQIVSSNALALGALVAACGGQPIQLGIAPDEIASLQRAAAGAAGADLLLTTGGASVGEHDLVRDALAAQGLELEFWRIALRPGKPLMVGRFQGARLIGLPGNPVSSLVCGLVFVKPALERLLGMAADETRETARLAMALPPNDRRQDYLRARCARTPDGTLEATPFERQDSAMMSLLAHSDCLVMRPPHAPAAAIGTVVPI
ncbi:MAG: molybdopterin molybdotransferase MoeA, partial [Alphaproteobacteria bacterium]|nr:molybdopterin molybdotransferase MoeA [Alphaproteobacteria bacterium]